MNTTKPRFMRGFVVYAVNQFSQGKASGKAKNLPRQGLGKKQNPASAGFLRYWFTVQLLRLYNGGMKNRIVTNPVEKIVLFAVVFASATLLLAFNPNSAQAFSAEEASVIRVTDNSWLYINQAEYGNTQGETKVPIAAVPSWVPRMQGDYLKYRVRINGQSFAGLDTNAMVLSDATIDGTQYIVPAGEKRTFTLFSIITLPSESETSPETEVSLEITDLPITLQARFNLSL